MKRIEFKELPSFVNNEKIVKLVEKTRDFPASIHKYHGGWEGGLYDHTNLVINLAFKCCIEKEKNIEFINDVVKVCALHDIGKMVIYSKKFNDNIWKHLKKRKEKFELKGEDRHIASTFYMLDKNEIKLSDKLEKIILFHHKDWGEISPVEESEMLNIVHNADWRAARIYKI